MRSDGWAQQSEVLGRRLVVSVNGLGVRGLDGSKPHPEPLGLLVLLLVACHQHTPMASVRSSMSPCDAGLSAAAPSPTAPLPTECPKDTWQPPSSCMTLFMDESLAADERRKFLADCAAKVGPFADYVDAYNRHLQPHEGYEEEFRHRAEGLLGRLNNCESCLAIVHRDLGLSYESFEPVDYQKSQYHLAIGCRHSFRTNAAARMNACMLLDTSDADNRELKDAYYRHAQRCHDQYSRWVDAPREMSEDWFVRR